jgi:bacterioferritin-associated ferredoxin
MLDLSWRLPFDSFDRLPRDVQDRLILEAVGGHHRTTMEITDALEVQSPDCRSCGNQTRAVVARLFATGDLGRSSGQWGPCRYRYFRCVSKSAQALDRALAPGQGRLGRGAG